MKIFVKISIFNTRLKNISSDTMCKEHRHYIALYNIVRKKKGKGGRNINHSLFPQIFLNLKIKLLLVVLYQ